VADERIRALEREYKASENPDVLEQLKRQWLRSIEWSECSRCKAHVPLETWESHLEDHAKESPRLVTIPAPASVAIRPKKMPLYDHEWLNPGMTEISFFANTGKDLWRSNFPGHGGSMPDYYRFLWYGISLLPDGDADPEEVIFVRDRATLSFRFQDSNFMNWPARIVIGDQPYREDQEEEVEELRNLEISAATAMPSTAELYLTRRALRLRHEKFARNVTVSDRPIEIRGGQFSVDLKLHGDVSSPVGLMVVLFGICMQPLTG